MNKITKQFSDLNGNWSKSWLLGRWQYEEEDAISLPPHKVGTALNLLSKSLIPKEFWNRELVEDLAGKTQPQMGPVPICLSIQGEIGTSKKEGEAFDLTLTTPFKSFREPHHISHIGEELRSGNLPSFLKGSEIGRLIPLKIKQFEISLVFYESKHIVFLGYNPTPTGEINCQYQDGALRLNLRLEQLEKKDCALLEKKSAYRKFKLLDLSRLR